MTALLKSALLLCTVAVCSCENSSLSYVAPSLGGSAGVVTSVERDLAERFLAYYETEWGHIQKLTDHIGHRIQAVVRKLHFWIPPDLSFRAKDPKSLRDKLMARCEHEENDFKSFPDIASAMYDVIGVRFTTYFPHLEIPSLIAMFRLTEGFHVVNVKEGKGEYLGTNIHLKIDGVDLEVQLRGAFHHSFYQVRGRCELCRGRPIKRYRIFVSCPPLPLFSPYPHLSPPRWHPPVADQPQVQL